MIATFSWTNNSVNEIIEIIQDSETEISIFLLKLDRFPNNLLEGSLTHLPQVVQ